MAGHNVFNMPGEWISPKLPALKTIRIRFSNKKWPPAFDVKNYLQYGAVRIRRYDHGDDHLHCSIMFDDADIVDKIVSAGCIYINDERIKIESMAVQCDSDPAASLMNGLTLQSFDDDDDASAASAHNDNAFDLMGLNDDCLRRIFRKLHIPTLFAVANVCVRFMELAKETYRLAYRKHRFRFCDIAMNYRHISLQRIEAFLQMFGSSIGELGIRSEEEFNYFDEYSLNDVLREIARNCPNLTVLDMSNLPINDTISNECVSLFSRLDRLHIKFANDVMNHAILQPNMLPKLTYCQIETRNYEQLQSFLQNNWQLEGIMIRCGCLPETEQPTIPSDFFQLLCERHANIVKLSITSDADGNFATNLLRFGELKRLRRFHLHFHRESVRPLLEKWRQNGIQLERLAIQGGIMDNEAFDIVSQFKTITVLSLHTICKRNDLVKLVTGLPSLDHLYIYRPHGQIIGFIKPIIANGKTLSTLIVFTCNGEISRYSNNSYRALLAVVEKRVQPIQLKVCIISPFEGPENVTHAIEIKLKPELLRLKIKWGVWQPIF